jgi:hypothetical protein
MRSDRVPREIRPALPDKILVQFPGKREMPLFVNILQPPQGGRLLLFVNVLQPPQDGGQIFLLGR